MEARSAKVQIGLRPVQKCNGEITTLRVAGGSLGWQVAGLGRGATVSRPRVFA